MRLEMRLAAGATAQLAVVQDSLGGERLYVGSMEDDDDVSFVEIPVRMHGEIQIDFFSPDGHTIYIQAWP